MFPATEFYGALILAWVIARLYPGKQSQIPILIIGKILLVCPVYMTEEFAKFPMHF